MRNSSIGALTERKVPTLQTMVPGSLDVERHEVHARPEGRVFREQAARDLLREEVVVRLRWEVAETAHQAVHSPSARVVDVHRPPEGLKHNLECQQTERSATCRKPKVTTGFVKQEFLSQVQKVSFFLARLQQWENEHC